MAVCALGFSASRAGAATELSTIYLQNGGKLRGEIVIDMPGAPLTVVVAGQAMQVPRESIARIDSGAAAPAPAPYAAQPAPAAVAAPVAVAPAPVYVVAPPPPQPAPVLAPAPPPAAPTGPLVLQFDASGRAAIDANWSPELQQLVQSRNDVAYSLKRKTLGGPVTMLSLGALGYIITAAATTAAANKCASSYDYDDYDSCGDGIPIGAGIGYTVSTVFFIVGTASLISRIVQSKKLKHQLAMIDQNLQRFSVQPIARFNGFGRTPGAMAGLTLRASF
jgi:hypothetical protein